MWELTSSIPHPLKTLSIVSRVHGYSRGVEIVNRTPFFATTLLISFFQYSGTQNLQLLSMKAMKKVLLLVGLSKKC
jgi:hypothetical protein